MSRVLITGRDVSKTQNWEAAANQQELFTKKQKNLLEKAAPGSRKHKELMIQLLHVLQIHQIAPHVWRIERTGTIWSNLLQGQKLCKIRSHKYR